jgi:CYTH domain-containing protein
MALIGWRDVIHFEIIMQGAVRGKKKKKKVRVFTKENSAWVFMSNCNPCATNTGYGWALSGHVHMLYTKCKHKRVG